MYEMLHVQGAVKMHWNAAVPDLQRKNGRADMSGSLSQCLDGTDNMDTASTTHLAKYTCDGSNWHAYYMSHTDKVWYAGRSVKDFPANGAQPGPLMTLTADDADTDSDSMASYNSHNNSGLEGNDNIDSMPSSYCRSIV